MDKQLGRKIYTLKVPEFSGSANSFKQLVSGLSNVADVWIDMRSSYLAIKNTSPAQWNFKPVCIGASNSNYNIESAVLYEDSTKNIYVEVKYGSLWANVMKYNRFTLRYTKTE